MRKLLLLGLLLASLVVAQTATEGGAKTSKTKTAAAHKGTSSAAAGTLVTPDAIQWADAPAIFPAGAKMAVLSGDPAKAGPFVVRLKFPDGYRIMPHWHPTSENVTVLSGEFRVAMGNKFDESQTKALPAGSYAVVPAHHNHYGMTKGETELQINSTGPFKLVYVNPADNPAKKK
jgi:quercetin dioxygenase-like cupin family protein